MTNTTANQWDIADRISDQIVDVINRELATMRESGHIDPLQLLVGHLLAFKALARTAPATQPRSFAAVEIAVDRCLTEIVKHRHQ